MFKNIAFFLIPVVVYCLFSFFVHDFKDHILLSLVVSSIIFWAFLIIPEYQTALYFLFGSLFFSLAPKEVVFSGFFSGAFWLVFAGMIMTVAIKNLDIESKIRYVLDLFLVNSYLKILIFVMLFALSLCFVVPSALSRTFIIIPLLLIVCSLYGFEENSKGFKGVMIVGILTNSLSGFAILSANLPNMLLAGIAEEIYDFKVLYSSYLASTFLIFILLKNMLIIALVHHYFFEKPKKVAKKANRASFNTKEIIVNAVFFLIVTLWMSDSLHGIKPSLVAILGALILVHPALKLVSKKDLSAISFPTLILVAALIGLGGVLSHNEFIKNSLVSLVSSYDFAAHSPFLNYMAMTTFASFSGIFLTQPPIPTLFTPIAENVSQMSGFSLYEVLMMEVASFSNIFFMHQTPPILIATQLANLKVSTMIKFLLVVAILSLLALYPLHYLWLMSLR